MCLVTFISLIYLNYDVIINEISSYALNVLNVLLILMGLSLIKAIVRFKDIIGDEMKNVKKDKKEVSLGRKLVPLGITFVMLLCGVLVSITNTQFSLLDIFFNTLLVSGGFGIIYIIVKIIYDYICE